MRGVIGRRGSMAEFFGRENLAGCWSLGQPNDFSDESGNKNNITAVGSVPIAKHLYESARLFNGDSANRLTCSSPSNVLRVRYPAILSWVILLGISSSYSAILQFGFTVMYDLDISSTGELRVRLRISGVTRVVSSGYIVPKGAKLFLAATYDEAVVRFFVNGFLVSVVSPAVAGGVSYDITNVLYLGSMANANTALNGLQGETAVLSSLPTDTQIADYYAWATQDGPLGRFNRLRRMRR